jgi:hypothetical protein
MVYQRLAKVFLICSLLTGRSTPIASHPQLRDPNFDPERSMEIRKIIGAAIESAKRTEPSLPVSEVSVIVGYVRRHSLLMQARSDEGIDVVED